MKKKLFVGPRIRRLRRDRGLTQAAMAEDLEVSVSYINLIERNQRPLTAELLLRMAQTYDLELASFAEEGGDKLFQRLSDAFRDPLFQQMEIRREDLSEMAAGNPVMAEAFTALYSAYRDTATRLAELQSARSDLAKSSPLEESRAFLKQHNNYFDMIDRAAEAMAQDMRLIEKGPWQALTERALDLHGLKVRVLPEAIMHGTLRRHDPHRREISLSESLDAASRHFQLALQLVFIELKSRIDTTLDTGKFSSENGRRISRLTLANYAAAAIIMPYTHFHKSAEELSYDIEALTRRYGVSFEQACHRLTSLQRDEQTGIPFFFLRVDTAGNVSKRYDGGNFPFARFGGACPLWNIHETFSRRRTILTQIIELPGGERFFSIARTVSSSAGHYQAAHSVRAVALGCSIQEAEKLIYTKNIDLEKAPAMPIGVTCRLCDRPDCGARAHPVLHHQLTHQDFRRDVVPFTFHVD
ncbi:MAG: helix-turn-helix domain-containing protein [bacterium]